MNKLFKYIIMTVVAVFGLAVVSCSDDDNSNGTPVITGVRFTDPAKADSLFTDAYAGNLIVIVGENLASAKEVYINGQSVPFELPYVTNTHIIVPIPNELKLLGTDPDLPSEIRVVTTYGECSYAFHVKSPDGYIESIAVSQYPLDAGVEVRLEGANFYEIQRLYYTDAEPSPRLNAAPSRASIEFDINDYRVSEKYDTLVFILPQTVAEKGWFVVDMYSNRASTKVSYKPAIPQIWSISSDMPISGEVVTLTGVYFIDIESIKLGSSLTLSADDINVAEDGKSLTFVMPELPSDYLTSMGNLIIRAAGGTVEVPFYDTKGLLLDWDNVSQGYWWGAAEGNTLVVVRPGDAFSYPHSGTCYGLKWWTDPTWWTNDGVMDMPAGAKATEYADIPVSELELRMEVLFIDFNQALWYFTFAGLTRDANGMLTDINGNQAYGHWSAYAFPLTEIGADPSLTWGDLMGNVGEFQFHFWVPGFLQGGEQQEFYLDNIRLYHNVPFAHDEEEESE